MLILKATLEVYYALSLKICLWQELPSLGRKGRWGIGMKLEFYLGNNFTIDRQNLASIPIEIKV
jgi:hypothetical protein